MFLSAAGLGVVLEKRACGFVWRAETNPPTNWTFDLGALANTTLLANTSSWNYSLGVCGEAADVCRPANCSEADAASCVPLAHSSSAGVAVQTSALAPVPPSSMACGAGPCTPVCNVLGAANASSGNATWRGAEWAVEKLWSAGAPNAGGVVATFVDGTGDMPFYAAASPYAPVACGAASQEKMPRALHVHVVCDPSAEAPALAAAGGAADDECPVYLTLKTRAACFNFAWRTGPWSWCHSNASGAWVETRKVECKEAANQSTSSDAALCDAKRKPLATVPCAPPPPTGLSSAGITMLVLASCCLTSAVVAMATLVVKQQREMRARRAAIGAGLYGAEHESYAQLRPPRGGYYAAQQEGL